MRWKGDGGREVYEAVLAVNAGFDQVREALGTFRKCAGFARSEIDRLEEMAAEARAATLSCITNVIETIETDEAGRLQARRLRRERRSDRRK
jgi:hypothetical protein